MNKVILKGNLANDPCLKTVTVNDRETFVVNFTLAVSRFFKRANGESDKDVVFIPCEAWDSGAENIGQRFAKGDPILIEGSLKVETWEKDEKRHSKIKVRVSNFEKLYRATPYEVET